jgi:N-acetylglucosamine malate deacetylase 1
LELKLDILAIAAHPDDTEISCSGTIAKHISLGYKVGVLDLTAGDLGTRGSVEIRLQESKNASDILGLQLRENLFMRDGFFMNDEEHQLKIIQIIRKYKPEVVLLNAVHDRHPDHGKGNKLAVDACFLSGLRKIETWDAEENLQEAWRPKAVYAYIQDQYIQPDFVVDISDFWDKKIESIKAFKSQFFDPDSSEPKSYISDINFLHFLEGRALDMGHKIGVKYGEGFTAYRSIEKKDLIQEL